MPHRPKHHRHAGNTPNRWTTRMTVFIAIAACLIAATAGLIFGAAAPSLMGLVATLIILVAVNLGLIATIRVSGAKPAPYQGQGRPVWLRIIDWVCWIILASLIAALIHLQVQTLGAHN